MKTACKTPLGCLVRAGRSWARDRAFGGVRRRVCLAVVLLAGCAEPLEQPALPEMMHLEVTVEGVTELRPARLFISPQGYAIYVLPQIVMTPEEPRQDQAFARIDGEFFVRIERLDPQADGADLRANAALALAHIGEVHALAAEGIFDPFFSDAEFFLHASNPQVSANMLVMEIDGSRFRVFMHIPNREAAEGILPSFWAMLRSIKTVTVVPPVQ